MAPIPDSKPADYEDPSKEMIDSAMSKGEGVKGLSEMHLTALPSRFIQPPEERISAMIRASPSSSTTIPIIDMSSEEAAESICSAAQNWGFFQVVNHGVPAVVLHNVMAAAQRFFALPAAEKRRFLKEYRGSTSVRYGSSFFPQAEEVLEWKDYLSMPFVSEDEAAAFWPAVCKDEALEYLKNTEGLIKRVLQILMKNLNVNKIDETNQSQLMGAKTIQFNYYPICPNPDLVSGVGRHSDISVVTILLQDEVGGLHVRWRSEGGGEDWVHVRPVAGSLVINVGDSLQIMSNGVYKSVEHCVMANGTSNRISIPIFVSPKQSAIVGPLPEVVAVATGQKAEYKEVLFSDYARHFFTKPHDGKDTLQFARNLQ